MDEISIFATAVAVAFAAAFYRAKDKYREQVVLRAIDRTKMKLFLARTEQDLEECNQQIERWSKSNISQEIGNALEVAREIYASKKSQLSSKIKTETA